MTEQLITMLNYSPVREPEQTRDTFAVRSEDVVTLEPYFTPATHFTADERRRFFPPASELSVMPELDQGIFAGGVWSNAINQILTDALDSISAINFPTQIGVVDNPAEQTVESAIEEYLDESDRIDPNLNPPRQ